MLLMYSAGTAEMNLLKAEAQNNERLRDYVLALSKMHAEPRDEAKIREAEKEFQALVEADGTDEIALASTFYGALIRQDFREQPDWENARRTFRKLYDSFPKSFFGQMALLKWVVIELNYDLERPIFSRIAMVEGYGDRFLIKDIQRSYYKTMGNAYQNSELSDFKAFEYLKKAYEIGFTISRTQSDLILSLAKLAEKVNERRYALERYHEFIEKYPGDIRLAEATEAIEKLEAED